MDTCAICLEELDSEISPIYTMCSGPDWNHQFHKTCIESWVNNIQRLTSGIHCPICRRFVSVDTLAVLPENIWKDVTVSSVRFGMIILSGNLIRKYILALHAKSDLEEASLLKDIRQKQYIQSLRNKSKSLTHKNRIEENYMKSVTHHAITSYNFNSKRVNLLEFNQLWKNEQVLYLSLLSLFSFFLIYRMRRRRGGTRKMRGRKIGGRNVGERKIGGGVTEELCINKECADIPIEIIMSLESSMTHLGIVDTKSA